MIWFPAERRQKKSVISDWTGLPTGLRNYFDSLLGEAARRLAHESLLAGYPLYDSLFI